MRFIIHRMLPCLIVLFLSTILSAQSDNAVPLRWKWEKGQVLRYRMIQEHRQGAPPGALYETVTRQTIILREEVAEVTTGGMATVHTSFEAVKMEMDTATGKMTYDSTNPSDQIKASTFVFRPIARLANATFTMHIDSEGNVTDLDGFEKAMSGLVPDQEGGGLAAGMNAAVKHMYSDQSMKQMMETSLHILPNQAVTVGESWNRRISAEMPMLGTMTEEATFTLDRIDEKDGQRIAHITSKSQLNLTAPAPYAGVLKSTMKSGSATGEIDFDIGQGCLHRQVQNIRIEIESTILGPSPISAPGRQTSIRRLSQTITTERLP